MSLSFSEHVRNARAEIDRAFPQPFTNIIPIVGFISTKLFEIQLTWMNAPPPVLNARLLRLIADLAAFAERVSDDLKLVR